MAQVRVPETRGRVRSIVYASPFLLFYAFPISSLVSDRPANLGFQLFVLGLYGVVYILIWLTADPMPTTRRISPVTVGMLVALFAIQLYMSLALSAPYVFMMCYIAPMVMLLPREHTLGLSTIITAITTIEAAILHHEGVVWSALAIVLCNVLFMNYRVNETYRERENRVAHARSLQRTAEQERLLLAAELHDVLGQQLTALSLKSSLLCSLLEAASAPHPNGTNEAAIAAATREATEINELSRQALSDVRKVVAGAREASMREELAAAQMLLSAASIAFSVEWLCDPDAITDASAVGRFGPYVVREGCTNVARHGVNVTTVHVRIDTSSISVIDDGVRSENMPLDTEAVDGEAVTEEASGSGLAGLVTRIGPFGTVEWGPIPNAKRGWHLTLRSSHKED